MIVSKCPLRVSLVGGSTDLIDFVKKHGKGSVISFPIDMYTYILLSHNHNNKYRINYLTPETVDTIDDIKNDVAREVLKHFNLPPVTIAFNADISSTGSGLASSSSYTIALVAAVNKFLNLNMTQLDICRTSLEIEHKFNPLTGYQDPYGCGLGGLKRLNFYPDVVEATFIKDSLLEKTNMYLVNTNSIRNSNDILNDIDFDKIIPLLNLVDELESNINNSNNFYKILNDAWEIKKKSSSLISMNGVESIGNKLEGDERIKAIKLCGAGGGGYFLVITEHYIEDDNFLKINVEEHGVQVSEI